MKAARLHEFHRPLVLEEVPDLQPTAPSRRDRARSVPPGCAGPTSTSGRASSMRGGEGGRLRPAVLHQGTRTPAGSRRSATRSPTSSSGDKVILHPLITCGLCRACRDGDNSTRTATTTSFPGLFAEGGFAAVHQDGCPVGHQIYGRCEPATDVAPARRRRPHRLPRRSRRRCRCSTRGRRAPSSVPAGSGTLRDPVPAGDEPPRASSSSTPTRQRSKLAP